MTPTDAPPRESTVKKLIRLCPVLATIRPTLEPGEAYAYAVLSDRAVAYPEGDSKIAYIGTGMGDDPVRAIDQTGRQFNRLRERWGTTSVVTWVIATVDDKPEFARSQANGTGYLLEAALMNAFADCLGAIPVLNTRSLWTKRAQAYSIYDSARLRNIIDEIGCTRYHRAEDFPMPLPA